MAATELAGAVAAVNAVTRLLCACGLQNKTASLQVRVQQPASSATALRITATCRRHGMPKCLQCSAVHYAIQTAAMVPLTCSVAK